MQALFELTEGLANLEKIIASFPSDSPHWNEAENRFQFIDRLLCECLGWEKLDMRVEVFDDLGGRSDYILGAPARAVLEAKREARKFDALPTGNPSVVRKIKPLLLASKDFSDAVNQVLPYCTMQGAQIAIVCNGPQLAIFQAFTPGHPPLEGECYLFNGFDSYTDNFPLLWSLLSPEGISENRAHRDLALHRNPRIPQKASSFISEPTRFRYRNDFQENLRAMSSLLLEEIEDNPGLKSSFYEECYVPLEANNRHLLVSKKIIEARYNRVGGDGVVPSALEAAAQAGRSGELILDDPAIVGAAGSRPIVVIGDVGVGKTSFFENLFENLEQSEKSNTYFVNINLGTKANLSTDLKTYVLAEIPAVLKREYDLDIFDAKFVEAIYYKEIKGFENSVKGALKGVDDVAFVKERIKFLSALTDRQDSHLHASLGHLARGRNKQIVLVMDNADQRSFEVQQEAFLIAQELAASRNLTIFIALRPSTFHLSKTTGALSGYQHKILTISPPPADKVIQQRLTFALRVAEGKVQPGALEGIRLQLGSVVSFLNATLRSIRTNNNIRSFLGNITGGNTRAVIELVKDFIGSPNVDSKKIVDIEEKSSSYQVPLHEFTKHALLGEYAYFNSQSSLVACNIFDVSTADPREHFLAGLIISYLSSSVGIRDNDGFMTGENILSEMLGLGYVDDQVRYALRRLAAKRLIETPYEHYSELVVPENQLPEEFHYRATSVGIYHIRFWTGSFPFLDAVSTDTPIFDEAARKKIANLAASFEIKDRFTKATQFKDYLEGQWQVANIGASYYDFASLLNLQDGSFDGVRRVVENNSRNQQYRK